MFAEVVETDTDTYPDIDCLNCLMENIKLKCLKISKEFIEKKIR